MSNATRIDPPDPEIDLWQNLRDLNSEIQNLHLEIENLPVERTTLRDQFATAALGHIQDDWEDSYAGPTELAEYAYEIADAMLKAREKKE